MKLAMLALAIGLIAFVTIGAVPHPWRLRPQ